MAMPLLMLGCASTHISYSIDTGKVGKSGRVGLKVRAENFKKKRSIRKEERHERRIYKKNQHEINKFNRKFQSRQSKKMMKRSARKSKRVNRNKHQYNIKQRIINRNKAYGKMYQNYYFNWLSDIIDKWRPQKKKTTISRRPFGR